MRRATSRRGSMHDPVFQRRFLNQFANRGSIEVVTTINDS